MNQNEENVFPLCLLLMWKCSRIYFAGMMSCYIIFLVIFSYFVLQCDNENFKRLSAPYAHMSVLSKKKGNYARLALKSLFHFVQLKKQDASDYFHQCTDFTFSIFPSCFFRFFIKMQLADERD